MTPFVLVQVHGTEVGAGNVFERHCRRTIACGHDVMLDRPEELTSLLLSAVQTSQAARAGS